MRLSTEASAVIEDKLVVAELEGLGEERSESLRWDAVNDYI